MPDVSKYAARDRRAAEIRRDAEIGRIALQLPDHFALIGAGMTAVDLSANALWLFCPNSGFRKITDLTWFRKHMKPGETVAQFRARLWCDGCRSAGCLIFVPGRHSLHNMPLNLRKPEVRALFIEDHFPRMHG